MRRLPIPRPGAPVRPRLPLWPEGSTKRKVHPGLFLALIIALPYLVWTART